MEVDRVKLFLHLLGKIKEVSLCFLSFQLKSPTARTRTATATAAMPRTGATVPCASSALHEIPEIEIISKFMISAFRTSNFFSKHESQLKPNY